MAKVEFDKKGRPSAAIFSSKAVLITDDVPINPSYGEIEPVEVDGKKVIPWFEDNDFPQKADKLINEVPSLLRALSDMSKITLGQGIFPCRVINTLPDGREQLEMITDPKVVSVFNDYTTRRYLGKCTWDIYSNANAFVQFIPNLDGTKIVKLNPIISQKCRLGVPDKKTGVSIVQVSGIWPDATKESMSEYTLLDEVDPLSHLNRLKEEGALAGKTVVMQIKNFFSSNDFYAMPSWYAAKKWAEIAKKIPILIDAGLDNVLNIFFVVRIPWSYWDRKYPQDEFESEKERKAKIEADIEMLETKFTSVENAKKALITHFGAEEGNADDKWEIEVLDQKFNKENFVSSTAADTQIALAAGISPDLLGLMYGNSKGGSMQRELLLLQYALSYTIRQQLADPIEMMMKFNDKKWADLQVRFRNTFLTTLDTGSGTGSTLS